MSETSNPVPPRRTSTTTAPPTSNRRSEPSRIAQDRTEPISTGEEPTGRKKAVLELIGVATLPLATMAAVDSARAKEEYYVSPWAMDAHTIAIHAEPLADAVVDLASKNPVLGNLLDRLAVVTPFGAILAAVMPLAFQLAENHGALNEAFRDNPMVNVIPREEFRANLIAQAMAAQNGHDS